MRIERKRIVSARLLLSVLLSMIMLSGLHCHEIVTDVASDCVECAHHVHHSGHFTVATDNIHDCVICQFLSLPFLAASATTVVLFVSLTIIAKPRNISFVCYKIGNNKSTRAPPFIL